MTPMYGLPTTTYFVAASGERQNRLAANQCYKLFQFSWVVSIELGISVYCMYIVLNNIQYKVCARV